MTCTIKISAGICSLLLFTSCIIQNPDAEDCTFKEITVARVYEGGVKDIVFAESDGSFYYINRGLENGMTLEKMAEKTVGKKVKLHLAKTIFMSSETNHISQLVVANDTLFSEL
ncbi:hypothetical protein ULMS_00950 [Patiriisocius marinistellae]|uniref:Uncharacterized protein n=1 Tax=Patiriisocius marinistellae TaxID=2494560 RepID=A0A5J4FRY3_9FLAO|nr:hypothetical protein [Patiriisocius marinistellae]GEQ84587.1 hypothetical protein ULMS_00950 [Patiriisocius marinistellae]